MKKCTLTLSPFIVFILLFTSCTSTTSDKGTMSPDRADKLMHYLLGGPKMLNPYNTNEGNSVILSERSFQSLLQLDMFSYELVPVLAKARPTISTMDDGKVKMDFELRPELRWDNGEKILAEDVAFSLKVMNCPKVDNESRRLYFSFIEDILIDKENPAKFSFICKRPYMLMESTFTDLQILPAYVYDPEGLLKGYTVKQLASGDEALQEDATLIKFAESFNSPKYQREVVVGSGPYAFDRWETNQRVVFKLKENWYGHQLKEVNHWFKASPKEIVYEVINDPTTAIVALKSEKIDLIYKVEPRVFMEELRKSESFNQKFNSYTPTQFLYTYIGMNMKNPKLDDVKTRKALRYIMDVDQLHNTIYYGLAERVTTFIHPSKKQFINSDLEFYKQDLEKARTLLAEGGWKDSNNNGILDKEVEGEVVELSLTMFYPNVAKVSEKAVLMFTEFARPLGVEIKPRSIDFSVMQDKLKAHDFDAYFGIWGASPLESDPTQIWHTDSQNGGSNYVGFGTPRSDELLEKLTQELDEATRIGYYKELQTIIDDEAPYIFMSAMQNRLAFHKRLGDIKTSGVRPGFHAPGVQMVNLAAN